ncbi:MAG TPA: hypothetical protein VNH11_19470 [Pirellulales bacterium]|nr:hypothetical protein [Pirellulales bacterium]
MKPQDTSLNDAFAQRLLAKAAQSQDRFNEPKAFYDADGDCIEVFLSVDNYRAERVNDRLTLYVNRDAGTVVGILLNRAKQLINDRFNG